LIIKDPEQLQSVLPPHFYQKLQSASKKKLTLRDLATYFKTDLLKLTLSLFPYIRLDKIGLMAVPDLRAPHLDTSDHGQEVPTVQSLLPSLVVDNAPAKQIFIPAVLTQIRVTPKTKEPGDRPSVPSITSPLIICVDNCPDTQKIVESTVTKAGYRYIGIKDSMLALPMIMEKKPDFILLNLVMPVVNGDEICTQIRRSDLFKQTPVFILTEKEGLVDLIRAKMSGNTDFIGKPIHPGKLLEIVKKYLGKPIG
ncbi:MAG: response regulator, partial [Microcoleaceae cyanobacterium]